MQTLQKMKRTRRERQRFHCARSTSWCSDVFCESLWSLLLSSRPLHRAGPRFMTFEGSQIGRLPRPASAVAGSAAASAGDSVSCSCNKLRDCQS